MEKGRATMAETGNYSSHKNGHAGATKKAITAPRVRSKIYSLFTLSIGSVAFGILLLALIQVYLLQGLSAGMLAIWVCCGIMVPALVMLGAVLLLFTKGIPREAAQTSGQRREDIQRRIDQIRHDLIEKTEALAGLLREKSSQSRGTLK
jgi:hypothetical protein